MPRPTYGEIVRNRALDLLDTLLGYVNAEFECKGCRLKTKWEDEGTSEPKLNVETTLKDLVDLGKAKSSESALTKAQVREALKRLKDFVQILVDNRAAVQGAEDWNFTLKLWSKDKKQNLECVREQWEIKRQQNLKTTLSWAEDAQSTPTPTNLPHPHSVLRGREEQLAQIDVALKPEETQQAPKFLVLTGMPGVGKSELALHYAYDRQSVYSGGVLLIRHLKGITAAGVVEKLIDTMKAVFDNLDISSGAPIPKLQYIWRRRSCSQPVLLVLEDIDDYSQLDQLREGLPDYVRVLVTARKCLSPQVKHIFVDPPVSASLEILQDFLTSSYRSYEQDVTILQSICQQLGHLPKALEVIAGNLNNPQGLPARKVLQALKSQGCLAERLDAAFEITWQDLSPKVQRFAALIGFCAENPIPLSFLETIVEQETELRWSSFESLQTLIAFNLVRYEAGDLITLHQLTHAFFAIKAQNLPQDDSLINFAGKKSIFLCQSHVDKLSFIDEKEFLILRPHIIKIIDTYSHCLFKNRQFKSEMQSLGSAYQNIGLSFREEHLLEKAQDFFTKALSCFSEVGGEQENCRNIAKQYVYLAVILRDIGDLEKAKQKIDQALALYRNLNPALNDVDSLQARTTLFSIKYKQKQLKGLEKEGNDLLEEKRTLYETNLHIEIAEMHSLLAKFYEDMNELQKALKNHLLSININETIFEEENHTNTAICYNNIGKCYERLGDVNKAKESYEKAINIFRACKNEFYTGWSLSNLCILLTIHQASSDVKERLKEACDILSQYLPKNHPHLIICYQHMDAIESY